MSERELTQINSRSASARAQGRGGLTGGRVALVGAGPGDPGLLTVRAIECLRRADYVLYDRLVPDRLLESVPEGARRVCVEELPGRHPERSVHIVDALVQAAQQGLRAVHLKGGDPFVFGRGGEEVEALRAAGVAVEVVAGVTAALGAAACTEIPLTHRQHASAVAFITGHQQAQAPLAEPEAAQPQSAPSLDWDALARFPGTLVFYMSMRRLTDITTALIEHGKDPATPATAIHQATRGSQRTLTATLAHLPTACAQAGLGPPAVVLVGSVVELRPERSWFENQPLLGQRILVTRPRHQAEEMVRILEQLGAVVAVGPTVELGEPADWGPVDEALAHLSEYRWLVFTSVNGVHALIGRLRQTGRDLRALGTVQLAAIGPATGNALRSYHLEPDLIPTQYRSENLAEALAPRVQGQRVLLARADRGRDVLVDQLAKICQPEQVAVYSQRDVTALVPQVQEALCKGEMDYITLTSANIARSLLRLLPAPALECVRSGTSNLVTISPVTSEAVEALGLPVAAEAEVYTVDGVIDALCRHLHG